MIKTEAQIEKSVIWNLINHPDRINAALEIISEKDFLHPLYRHAFSTISKLNKEGRIIDLPTLYLEMGRPEIMSPIIGSDDDTLFGPVHYANLLRQRNIENDISEAAREREYETLQDRIKELHGLGTTIELGKITEIIEKGEKRNEVISTGYRDLDTVVKIERTDLVVLAGRPGVGKSLFGCSILANMAIQNPVGVISFEMSDIKIVKRLSYGYSMNYLNEINDNFLISSPSIFNLREVRKTLNEMVLKRGAKVILVDYLQLMSETKEFRSRHLEVSYIIRSFKELAKEFQVALIVISSLSRGEKSGESRPVLSDLKESGDIEYASDVVCFLHRTKQELNADLIIAKNRNGKNGLVRLVWIPEKIMYGTHEWKEE